MSDAFRHVQKDVMLCIGDRNGVSFSQKRRVKLRTSLVRVEHDWDNAASLVPHDDSQSKERLDPDNFSQETPVSGGRVVEAIDGLEKPHIDIVVARQVHERGKGGCTSQVPILPTPDLNLSPEPSFEHSLI